MLLLVSTVISQMIGGHAVLVLLLLLLWAGSSDARPSGPNSTPAFQNTTFSPITEEPFYYDEDITEYDLNPGI